MLFKTKINTKEQRMIFEDMFADKLTNPERRSVINFGAEMYRDGIKKGLATAVVYYVAYKIGSGVVHACVKINDERRKAEEKKSYTEVKDETTETAEDEFLD